MEKNREEKIHDLEKNILVTKKEYDTIRNRLRITIKYHARLEDTVLQKVSKMSQRIHCKYHTLLYQLKKIDPTNELVKDLPEKSKHKSDHKHVNTEKKKGLDTVQGIYHNENETCSSTDIPTNVVVLARTRRKILISVSADMLFSYLMHLVEHDDNFIMIKTKVKKGEEHTHNKINNHVRFNDIIGTGLKEGNIFKNEQGKLHVLCISKDNKIPVYCNHKMIRDTLTTDEYGRWRTICREIVMRKNLVKMKTNAKIFYCSDPICVMATKGFICTDDVKPLYASDMVIRWRDVSIECPICKKSVISVDEATKRTESMLSDVSRKCPSCGTPVMRDSGCYHVKCPECKLDWCWNCGKLRNPNDPYKHSCPPELQDDISRRYDHPDEVWVEGIPQLNEEEMILNGLTHVDDGDVIQVEEEFAVQLDDDDDMQLVIEYYTQLEMEQDEQSDNLYD